MRFLENILGYRRRSAPACKARAPHQFNIARNSNQSCKLGDCIWVVVDPQIKVGSFFQMDDIDSS